MPTNPAAVSPLDVLQEYALQHGSPDDFIAVIDAVRQLLAADREYDEAWEAFKRADPNTAYLTHNAMSDRVNAAHLRRAAALARFEP